MTDHSPSQESPVIVAYALKDVLAVYWGELMDYGDSSSADMLYLGKPMVMLLNPKDPNETSWTKPIACGKESVLGVDPKIITGTLVLNPDYELVSQYQSKLLQAYTTISLLR